MGQTHSESPLDLAATVQDQQGREVFDLKAASQLFPQAAAKVHVIKPDFLLPFLFQPIHDGPGCLAAQSKIRIKVQEADRAAAKLLLDLLDRPERARPLPAPDGDGPNDAHGGNQRRPQRPGSIGAAHRPGCQDKSNAGSNEQRMPRDKSKNRVNGALLAAIKRQRLPPI